MAEQLAKQLASFLIGNMDWSGAQVPKKEQPTFKAQRTEVLERLVESKNFKA